MTAKRSRPLPGPAILRRFERPQPRPQHTPVHWHFATVSPLRPLTDDCVHLGGGLWAFMASFFAKPDEVQPYE